MKLKLGIESGSVAGTSNVEALQLYDTLAPQNRLEQVTVRKVAIGFQPKNVPFANLALRKLITFEGT